MLDPNKLKGSLNRNRRYVIGIDGLSRSGKTTFVEKVKAILEKKQIDCTIIHLDHHIVEKHERYQTGMDSWVEYYHLQWDVERLRDALFRELATASSLTLPFYYYAKDECRDEEIRLPSEGVIVVEGVFLQREEWRAYLDHVYFLDCPRETRFNRESEHTQANINKFQERYWKAEDYYMNKVHPLSKADHVLLT
ncbi:uridine kinase [Pontibacillus chungwhensis BH030062]|uniref:Uridine kinase n=1 Tax=Pontibacillus chungwhensis BH030062 TaxID=1385513 RepID=A0A0A2UVM6_9BACI|nr:kinase [Pontibacillus chungwhensis]KGP90561.1 uridine kinase [Pontibacillus chungwhensis BH030062]